jgi:predicted dehydrogenase
MKIAAVVVGANNAAQLWLPTLRDHPLIAVRALADLDRDLARRRIDEHRLCCAPAGGLDEALAGPAADARLVIDLTPPATRVAIARIAFAHGCDVFGEKPLAPSLADAAALVDLARAAGRRYAVMQNRRFHPGMRSLRAAVESGLLGRVHSVDADFRKTVPAEGRLGAMASPLLADMAIHTFDQARYLVGDRPARVHAHEWSPPHSPFAGDAAAVCTFEFAGGCVFSYRGSWVATGQETPWFSAWRLMGSEGTASWDGDGVPEAEVVTGHGPYGPVTEPRPLPSPADARTEHPGAIDAMLRALADGTPFPTDAADNVASLAMVDAVLRSSRAGAWVEIGPS